MATQHFIGSGEVNYLKNLSEIEVKEKFSELKQEDGPILMYQVPK